MTDANEALRALILEAMRAGYEAGHHWTVEGGYSGEWADDHVDEWIEDCDLVQPLRAHLTYPGYVRVPVEPVDIVLGNGDKMIADIYDHDGEWAGVGIFHGGRGVGVGVRMPEHDGKNIEDLDAICLIRSTSVESLRVLAQECNEAIARMQGAAAQETSHD